MPSCQPAAVTGDATASFTERRLMRLKSPEGVGVTQEPRQARPEG